MTDLQQSQLDAFDEVAGLSGILLKCNGGSAVVIAAAIRNSRLLEEAGYLPGQLVAVDIKRTDFDRLRITQKSTVIIEGKNLRPADINDDPVDPIVNLTLTTRH
jgi:hypothetical protein